MTSNESNDNENIIIEQEKNKRQKINKNNSTEIFKCNFIKPKNNKRCGLQVRKGQKFCFAHINQIEEKNILNSKEVSKIESNITRINKNGDIIKRVKCTVDPTHTVWEDNLTKHIKVCNIIKKKQEIEFKEENCPWFNINYNVKDIGNLDNDEKLDNKKLDYEEWKKFINKWELKHDLIFTEELPLENIEFKTGLEERFAELSNKKHILQQSSLIGQLVNNNIINQNSNSNSNLIIEFGCGRAEFTRYFNKAMNKYFENPNNSNNQYLLIDRENPRLKFDKKIVKDSEDDGIKHLKVERLKIDIKDLKLIESLKNFQLNSLNELNFIGISKHLCGVATDLTLRCLINAIKDSEIETNKQFNFNFGGCLVAMCCRHCCKYEWLLKESKEFLKDNFDIDETNFIYFRKMFAWATNGISPGMSKSDKCDHFSGLSFEEREIIGLKMRRILDESRKYAIEKKGFNVKIVRYVERDVSLENNCIIIKNDKCV